MLSGHDRDENSCENPMIVHTGLIFNDWWLIMCRSKNCWNNGKWFKHPLFRQFLKGPWAAPIWSSMMIWMRNLLYIKKQHIQIKRDPRKRNGLVSKWKRSHDATCLLWNFLFADCGQKNIYLGLVRHKSFQDISVFQFRDIFTIGQNLSKQTGICMSDPHQFV